MEKMENQSLFLNSKKSLSSAISNGNNVQNNLSSNLNNSNIPADKFMLFSKRREEKLAIRYEGDKTNINIPTLSVFTPSRSDVHVKPYDQSEDTPMKLNEDDFLELINEEFGNQDDKQNWRQGMNQNQNPNSINYNSMINEVNNSNQMVGSTIKAYYQVLDVIALNKNVKLIRCEPCILDNSSNELFSNVIKIKLKGLWAQVIIEPEDFCYISASYVEEEECYEIADEYWKNQYSQQPENLPKNPGIRINKANSGPINNNFEMLENFIIVEPETLISPSRIKTAFPCYRKSIFGENFKTILNSIFTQEFLIGNIVHEAFQTVIQNCSDSNKDQISTEYIEKKVERILKKYTVDMAIHNFNPDDIERLSKGYINSIMKFFHNYFINKHQLEGVKIKSYIGSEKAFQSQVLGMKGVMDMLVETENESKQKETTPLELKTGNSQSNSDILQVLTYCLILSEQLGKNSYNGLLCYIKKDTHFRIKVKKNDIINVIVVRNNMAKYMKKVSLDASSYQNGLPDIYYFNMPSHFKTECSRCFQKEICFFHYANYEKNVEISSKEFSPEEMSDSLCLKKYLSDEDTQTYFNYFYTILNEEEAYSYANEKSHVKDGEIIDLSEFREYIIESVVDKDNSYDLTVRNVADNYNDDGELIEDREEDIVSQFVFINDGYHIYEPVNKKSIVGVLVNKSDSYSTKFTLNILKHYITRYKQQPSLWSDPRVKTLHLKNICNLSKFPFRLMRGNLITLCMGARPRLKELIVNHAKPQFNLGKTGEIMEFIKANYNKEFSDLNRAQKTVLLKALVSEDYTLIIGFPGSGKTTLIAFLVDILVKKKQRVIVTAHTNTAVDNILLKLKQRGVNFVRITNQDNNVHPEIRGRIFKNQGYETFSDWRGFIDDSYVYGVTTLGVYSKYIINTRFDYCIVDEACQILEASMLGPLLLANKFVLVGDPFQLPALIRSCATPPPSLFERLQDKWPETAFELNEQYRMNEQILKLSNHCVYNYKIKCAKSSVSSRKLDIDLDQYQNTLNRLNFPKWIYNVYDPSRPIILVDYIKYLNKYKPDFLHETTDSNQVECSIIKNIISGFKTMGFDMDSVGIITPYKSQESLLYSTLAEVDFFNIYTIDKCQGIEKEVIIISFVKTNTRTRLLKDLARINVAFTRPKSKLIIIGLVEFLEKIEKLKNFVNLIRSENWLYYLEELSNQN